MADPELMSYVQTTLKKGYSQEQVKNALISQGWPEPEVSEAMNLALKDAGSHPSIINEINQEYEKLRKSSAVWFVIISIVILAGGAGAFFLLADKDGPELNYPEQINSPEIESPLDAAELGSYQDCGSSEPCFTEFAKTCTKAEALITTSTGNIKFVYRETIEGLQNGDCILTLVYTSSSIPSFIGKDMICRVPKNRLNNYKDYFEGERMKQACKGSLVDFLIQQGAAV